MIANFIIAGPPKCGTTSVFEWLSQHSNVCPSILKETNYFIDTVLTTNKNANFIDHGISGYESLFPNYNGEKIVLEATPEYLYSELAIEQFSSFQQPPSILFIFRDPTDRLYSEYTFHRYKTGRFKKDFKEFCGHTSEGFSGDKVERGKIVTHINQWVDSYPGHIRVMHFDILKNSPHIFMKELCDYLEIDFSEYQDYSFDTKNKTTLVKHKAFHKLALRLKKNIPDVISKSLLPLYQTMNQTSIPEPSLDEKNIISDLKEFYRDETYDRLKL